MQTCWSSGARQSTTDSVMIPALADALKGWMTAGAGREKDPRNTVVRPRTGRAGAELRHRGTEKSGRALRNSRAVKLRTPRSQGPFRSITTGEPRCAVSWPASAAGKLLKPSAQLGLQSAFFADVRARGAVGNGGTYGRQPAAGIAAKLVTSGIMADNSGLLGTVDDCGVAVVDDGSNSPYATARIYPLRRIRSRAWPCCSARSRAAPSFTTPGRTAAGCSSILQKKAAPTACFLSRPSSATLRNTTTCRSGGCLRKPA